MSKDLILWAVSAIVAHAACVPVGGERILGRNLAAANAAFASVAPDQVIAFAPSPGRVRLMGPQELARLAARYGVEADTFQQVCFERVTEPLTAARLIPALRKALEMPQAEIHILDFSRYPLPPGQLEFSRTALPAAPPNGDAEVLWRGHLMEGEHHSIPIWVKVKILVEQKWIEAVSTLFPGRPIAAGQVVLKSGKAFPPRHPMLKNLSDVIGHQAVRSIRPGQAIEPQMLREADAVKPGDLVSVQVLSGSAQLHLTARAESAGGIGDIVALQNPAGGKTFRAVVQGEGKVVVNSDAHSLETKNRVGSSADLPGRRTGQWSESVR